MLALVLPANFAAGLRWKIDLSQHPPDIPDGAAEVAVFKARGQVNHQVLVFAQQLVLPVQLFHLSQGRKRRVLVRRSEDREIADAFEIISKPIRKSHPDAHGAVGAAKLGLG